MRPVSRRTGLAWLAASALPWPARTASARGLPLRVGLVPYLSTRAVLSVWDPLREHLEAELGRPVEFLSSVSFEGALDNARRDDQPVSLLPAHFARLAMTDWKFTLLARPQGELSVQLWTLATSALQPGASLAGRRAAVIDPLALTSLMFDRWRLTAGEGAALQEQRHPSTSSALLALRRGEVDVAVTTDGQVMDALGPEGRSLLRPLARIGSVVAPCFLAAPGFDEAQAAALRAALLQYRPARAGGVSGGTWSAGSPRDFEPFEPYAEMVRRHLAARSGRR